LRIFVVNLTDEYLGPLEVEAHTNELSAFARPLVAFRHEGNEMRFFLAALITLTVVYFADAEYNQGKLYDGVRSMGRAMSHSFR
jgi:hypothetical protein